MRLQNFTIGLVLVTLIGYLLIVGKAFLMPLVIAVVLWYLVISLARGIQEVALKGISLPHWVCLILAFAIFSGGVWAMVQIVEANVDSVVRAVPAYQAKFVLLIETLGSWFTGLTGVAAPEGLAEVARMLDLGSIANAFLDVITTVAGNMAMIVIYMLFLFLEYETFDAKLKRIANDDEKYARASAVIQQISTDVNLYVRIKTMISLATAGISYVIMLSIGLDFAGFWALLIFVLNFIPSVGSVIAVMFPVFLALIQFGGGYEWILVLVLLMAVQFTLGNLVEPRLMGTSLNLSPLVIILSLALWGQIWGVIGMILCVPIMVIMNIILAHFPATRAFAVMMSSRHGADRQP